MRRASSTAILYAGLGAVLFSAKAIVVKLSYRHGADTETVLALRMLFSLPFFWTAVWWYTATRKPAPLVRKDVERLLLLGFVGYTCRATWIFSACSTSRPVLSGSSCT